MFNRSVISYDRANAALKVSFNHDVCPHKSSRVPRPEEGKYFTEFTLALDMDEEVEEVEVICWIVQYNIIQ